jgi:hypothetical protein
MLTIGELQNWFRVYYLEVDKCRSANAWWAALHLALVIPDVCSSLEDPGGQVGDRYVKWCGEHFPPDPKMTPADRYQMRCMVLHQGSSLPQNKGAKHHSRYDSFSFVRPEDEPPNGDVHFAQDHSTKNITVYVRRIVISTFDYALAGWFRAVASDSRKNAAVKSNLSTLMHPQGKELPVAHALRGEPFIVISST